MKYRLSQVTVYGAVLFTLGMSAHAGVVVSVGYYDLTALNPWLGSPNTDFLGNSTNATSSDPDDAAILFQNTGGSALTLLQGFNVSSSIQLWDSLIGTSGFTIQPGHNLILSSTNNCFLCSNFDGSDISGTFNAVLSGTLNGGGFSNQTFSLTDTNSILHGAGASDESEPWTQLGTVNPTTQSATPEPGTFVLLGVPLVAIGVLRRRGGRPSRA